MINNASCPLRFFVLLCEGCCIEKRLQNNTQSSAEYFDVNDKGAFHKFSIALLRLDVDFSDYLCY